MADECPLSPRQLQMVEMIAEGLTYKQIASHYRLSVSTVRTHVHRVYFKLDVVDRAQAVLECARHGWLVTGQNVIDQNERAIKRCLADATLELVSLIKRKRQLTPVQEAYLNAFDELVRAHSDVARQRAERLMGLALGPMLGEAGVTPSGRNRRRRRDLVSALVALATQGAAGGVT